MVVKNREIDLHLLFVFTNFFWPRLHDLGKMKTKSNPLFIPTRLAIAKNKSYVM